MHKLFLLGISLLLTLSTLFAQNDKGKKVETQFLQIPGYDISSTDPTTVQAEFAAGESSFGTEKIKDTKSICKPKGGGIKDAVEISTYYYEVPFTQPESFLIAKDADGNIVYAHRVSAADEIKSKFGFNKCEYWIAQKMKKDWESKKTSFKSKTTSDAVNNLYGQAQAIAAANVYPQFIKETFDVFTAKGKDFDYSELDQAFEQAMEAYNLINKNGPSAMSFEKLNNCITTWKKELKTLDLENKKARINKAVAKGLYENLANAYMYTYQMNNALDAAIMGKKLYGNFSNNRSNALVAKMQLIETRQIAADRNAAIASDPVKLNALGKKAGSSSVTVKNVSGTEYSRIKSEYYGFTKEVAQVKVAARNERYEEAVASGEINPYDKYVTQGITGRMIMMSPLTMAPKFTELPAEMCDITDLNQLIIMNNDISSVPPAIGNLKELNKLDLSKNNITSIPKEIGNLTKLKTLNLSNNPITELPETIKNCTSLKTVNIKGTKISAAQQQQLKEWLPNAKIKF